MGIKNKSTRLKEFYATIVATIPVTITGMLAGFPAFIMFQLQKEMDLTIDDISWLVFAGYFSLLFGPLIVVHLISKYGRKTNLRLVLCLFIIGWSIILVSTSFATLLIGTALCGIAAGGSLPIASTYIAEISRARYRGSLLAMVWLMGIFGTAFVYILEISFTWRGVVLMIVGLAAFGLTQLQVIPESRMWHLLKKRKEDALESTSWFENTKVAVKETEILHSLMSFGKNFGDEDDLDTGILSCKALKRLQIKPLLLSLSVVILRCGTGKVLFTVYPIPLFTDLGTPYDGKILGMGFGLLNFICILANMMLFSTIDRFNRKNFFFVFNIIMIVSLTGVIVLQSMTDNYVKPLPGLLVFFMYVYLIAEGTGYSSMLNIMVMEVAPVTQRNVSHTLHFIVGNVVTAIYVKVFPLIQPDIPFRTACVFFLFNVMMVLLIVYFYYPNTRGNMFAGYEMQFLKSLRNSEIEKLISNDWLRNEDLQALLTGNEHLNIEVLNSEIVTKLSKECADCIRNLMGDQNDMVRNFINDQEQRMRLVDETNEDGTPSMMPMVVNQMQPVIPEEVFDSMKQSFNSFMENSPIVSKNPFFKANKSMIMQQQEWLKNTWLKAAKTAGNQPKRSRSPKSGQSSGQMSPKDDYDV
ncbi:glucose transporter GlcP-like [Planococcus citri]|uniref:glucose transporter GlcP-like n=1 Tax=Planococcus citri TaxID=170843 RepID=UPI0031F82926